MSRRSIVKKRYPTPDPTYNSLLVSLLTARILKSGKKRHNIFGLWSAELKDQLRKDLEAGDRKVEDWANKIGTEIIELDPKDDNSFLNINTKIDLEEASKKI